MKTIRYGVLLGFGLYMGRSLYWAVDHQVGRLTKRLAKKYPKFGEYYNKTVKDMTKSKAPANKIGFQIE